MELNELKRTYRIAAAWRDLGLPGEPGKCVQSPFREDHSPSFSVFGDGTRWKDFATGEGGDVLDLLAKARGCNTADAIGWLKARLGIVTQPNLNPASKSKSKMPPLRFGSDAELRELAERRSFAIEALRLAQSRNLLRFGYLWGHRAWCVCDSRGQLHEFRRLDGEKWPAYGRLAERKAHCVGVGKAWPVGTLESEPFPQIAWVEGAPDLVATFHFILAEQKQDTVAPVGILGASNYRLAADALARFRGKMVLMYPHLDEAGRRAGREWARQLKDAGATRVTAIDLSGLLTVDGSEGKDLADVCRISPDCFESPVGRKFWEVMP